MTTTTHSAGARPLGLLLTCVGLAAGALLGGACTVETGDTPPATDEAVATESTESAPAETPAETGEAAETGAVLGDAESGPAGPGAVERLDTGVDLTALRLRPQPDPQDAPGTSLLTDPQPEGGVGPAVGAQHAGLPGHLSMQEGQEPQVDFGKVHQGDKRSHVFGLVSDGEADLVITRFKSSCGCTVGKMLAENDAGEMVEYAAGDPIPSGRKFELHMDLKTDGKPQGKMETSVSLYSNDVRGVFTLRMRCEVQTVLTVTPQPTINFGQLTPADRVEGSVQLTSESLEPFLLTYDERFVNEVCSVEVEPVEPNAEGRSTTWDVRVSLGPNTPEGLRNYPVLLLTDAEIPYPKAQAPEGKPPVYTSRVYVQATVKGLVTASPSFLTFGMVRPGQVVERKVQIECFDDFVYPENVPVRLEAMRKGMEFPNRDRFSLSLSPTENPKVLDLTLRLEGMPEDFNGSFGGYVYADVGHPLKESVAIRFSGVCRQGLPEQPTGSIPQTPPQAGSRSGGQ